MPIHAGNIGVILLLGLWLVVFVIGMIRMLRSKFGPVITVKARVVDKNKIESFSKYTGKTERYAVVFEAKGKKLSFYVSAFSYGGYRIGETGTLQYRGNQLISFE